MVVYLGAIILFYLLKFYYFNGLIDPALFALYTADTELKISGVLGLVILIGDLLLFSCYLDI